MAHGLRCARSVRHDLGPNIFPSGPPTQSISTYYSNARRFYSSMGVVLGRSRCEWLKNVTNIYAQFIGNFIKLYGRNHYESNSPHSSYIYFGVVLRPGHTRRQVSARSCSVCTSCKTSRCYTKPVRCKGSDLV